MKTPKLPRALCALAGTLVLAFVSPAFAADYYATPSGAGAQTGSSWADAYPQTQIQAALDALAPGDTLNLGSGTYTLTSLTINGSGSAGTPKTLLGVDTGSGIPLFQGTFNVANSANGAIFVRFPGAANHWVFKNLQFKNHPFVIAMVPSGTTDTLRTNISFENLAFDSIEDCIRIFNASNVTVKNCTMVRYTKRGVRVGDPSSFVTVQNCSADCNGGDDSFPARAIPAGFHCESGPVHDVSFIDCTARNNRYQQSSTSYWNGDGFGSERGNYNISFLRCAAYDNHDGGFDNKADDITYEHCVAAGNSRGFRHWGLNGQMTNCVVAFNSKWGGTGASYGLWVSENNGDLTASFTTVHNSGTAVHANSGGNAVAAILDSILSTTSATAAFTSGNVTLTNTATFRPGVGTDPNYVDPISTWRGFPLDAMDSQTYGLTKGYSSDRVVGGDTNPPTVPTGLVAGTIATNAFILAWNASTDAESVVTGYEVFKDGASYATPAGTSVTVSGLSPGTTYAMTVRARDVAGNWSAQSTALNVTTAAAGGTIRIEAGASSPFSDVEGNVWAVDHSFVGGSATDRGAIAIANTLDDRIYQTERWGLTGYAIAVPNATYTVNVHFAETFSGITAAGQRVFSVTAEGASPAGWSNIDIFAEAGGRNIALVKTASVTVSDGTLNLDWIASLQSPIVNAIEIVPPAGSAVISVNLSDATNVLAPGDIVGAVPAANWNNTTANNQTLSNVVDTSGVATTADIIFSNTPYAYNNNTPAYASPLTDDAKMMRSQRGRSNASTMSATAQQVPYATYDVYVYWGGRTPQESVPMTMTVDFQLWDGAAWVTAETKYIRDSDRVWDGTYNESTATSAAAATDGNEYVVFRGVTAATFRVSAASGVRTGICGLQIVQQ